MGANLFSMLFINKGIMVFGKKGVLLVNLGTPNSPTRGDVYVYLREFLTDPRVIDIPWLPRQLLVKGIIAPFPFGVFVQVVPGVVDARWLANQNLWRKSYGWGSGALGR